jgi:integrase
MQEVATGGALDHHTHVADLADRWLQDAAGRLKPKTVQAYRSNVTMNVVPVLGKTVVSDLRPSHVRRLHVEVFSRGVGPATVAAAHRTLSAMLSYAVDEGLIARNVAESVDIPRQAPSERDSLTRAETQALLELGDPQWSLALLSGARDGEIRALRRSDLDLEAGRLTISWTMAEAAFKHGCGGTCGRGRSADCPSRAIDVAASLQTKPLEGRWVLVRPKAYKPRTVPLTPETITALRMLIDDDTGRNPHGLLWHKPNGQPLSNTDSNSRLRAALEAAGVDRKATVHWLRHTYTTMAEHAGIEWVVYAGISGHASQGISRRYTHQLEQEARNGIERLNHYLHTP